MFMALTLSQSTFMDSIRHLGWQILTVLFKEKGEHMNSSPPSCLMAVANNQQEPFPHVSPLFQTPNPGYASCPVNGFGAHQQSVRNGPVAAGQSLAQSAQMLSSSQKLSHQGPLIPQADTTLPSLQQLQLQDIFSTSLELPTPCTSADGASLQSCGQVFISPMGCPQGIPGPMEPSQPLLCPQNNLQPPAMAANGRLLPSSGKQPVAPGMMDILPPLIPCNDFSSSASPSLPIPFAAPLHGKLPFGTHNQQVQPWQQSQQQKLPHGHDPIPANLSQTSEHQTFPHAGLWPRSVTGLNHTQQGGPTRGQPLNPSSCMFDQHCSSSPAGGDVLDLPESCLDSTNPQGSWYFQWSHGEPVQNERVSTDLNGVFAPPAHNGTTYLTE